MIKKEIKSNFLGTINGIEFKNPELYEKCLGTLNLIETEKEVNAEAVKATKNFYINLRDAKDITLKEVESIANFGIFNAREKYSHKIFQQYDPCLLDEKDESVTEILQSFTKVLNELPKKMKTNLKEELKKWLPAFEEIIKQEWKKKYENSRDMANDWSESAPFEKISCEKSKNISSKELMKLIFETMYLVNENETCFDIQDIESQDENESMRILLKVFISEAVLYLIRRNYIETSEIPESEAAKKIINIIK